MSQRFLVLIKMNLFQRVFGPTSFRSSIMEQVHSLNSNTFIKILVLLLHFIFLLPKFLVFDLQSVILLSLIKSEIFFQVRRSSYCEAIEALNALQTNSQVLESVMKERHIEGKNLAQTRKHLLMSGMTLNDLVNF